MRRWSYLNNGASLALDAAACVGCGACLELCPHGVFSLEAGKARIAHRESCMECGACAGNCPTGALSVKAGVGCAAAVINGLIRGTAPSCDCGCDHDEEGPSAKRADPSRGCC
ncbi:MAG: 4Fe-4S binding protein [Spirochaetaceae bacterium]|nr:4Fe-4S binding protein [Spirochaetaceae bacterium]